MRDCDTLAEPEKDAPKLVPNDAAECEGEAVSEAVRDTLAQDEDEREAEAEREAVSEAVRDTLAQAEDEREAEAEREAEREGEAEREAEREGEAERDEDGLADALTSLHCT